MIYQKKIRSEEKKIRSLNLGKAIAMAICPTIAHFIT